jgi:hypothetical protein
MDKRQMDMSMEDVHEEALKYNQNYEDCKRCRLFPFIKPYFPSIKLIKVFAEWEHYGLMI